MTLPIDGSAPVYAPGEERCHNCGGCGRERVPGLRAVGRGGEVAGAR